MKTSNVLVCAILILSVAVYLTDARSRKPDNYRPPKRTEPVTQTTPDYTEPLSMAEIEAMGRDAPLLLRIITDNQMLFTNGTLMMKSSMDAAGPLVMKLFEQIEETRAKLPPDARAPLNLTSVREGFIRDWKECNKSIEKAQSSFAIKAMLEKMDFSQLRENLKDMPLEQQINMRNVFTHARDKVMDTAKAPMFAQYKNATENSISVMYKTLLDLMTAHKDLRYQLAMHHIRESARARFRELWDQMANDESVNVARAYAAGQNPDTGMGRYSAQ